MGLHLHMTGSCLLAAALAGCGFGPAPGPYTSCDALGACPAGCQCVAGWICASDAPDRAPWECLFEPPACELDSDCKLGCTCLTGGCEPDPSLADRIDPTYCAAGLEPTCMQVERTVDSPEALAEALSWAAATPGAHRIRLDPGPGEDWLVTAELPAVPGLTYIDGGSATLVGDGSRPGLRIEGVGAAVSDLELSSFGTYGLRVEAGSRDVALFRLRVIYTAAGPDPQSPSGHGIYVRGEAGDPVVGLSIGRGRALACVEPRTFAQPDPPESLNDQFDVDAIFGNAGDGIRIEHADGVSIYGAWVGFDNLNDPGHGSGAALANAGAGVHLLEVTDARVGAQQLLDSEARAGQFSPLPAYVGIGRNHEAGLWIEGGGRIEAPGLILGNAPTMVPYDQNQGPGLIIEGNRDFVHIGPAPSATGADAQHFSEVFSEGRPMIEVIENKAPVWIRGVQLWSASESSRPRAGVEVIRASAPVRLHQLTLVYHFGLAGVYVEDLQSGGQVELINDLFFTPATLVDDQATCLPSAVPLVASSQAGGEPDPGAIAVLNNMDHCFTGWCQGDCDVLRQEDNVHFPAGTFTCSSTAQAEPLVPTCPNVDAGRVIESSPGQPLHMVGSPGSAFIGCAPDVGFIECSSLACRSVSCP